MSIADLYDAFLLDLDGDIYVGQQAVPGAAETVAELRRRGKGIVFVTNDSRGLRPDYVAKLAGMGIPATVDDILTAASATAAYMRERHPVEGRSVYAIGPAALKAELAAVGLRLVEGDAGRTADFVAVAFHQGFDYWEMLIAGQAARRGAHFYGTNRDAVFPMPDGLWPATGAVLAGVEVAAGRQAEVVGKPELPMIEVARRRLPAAARLAIVGDTLGSDVLGGLRAGIGTVLVLSGNTTQTELDASPIKPTYVIPSIASLI
ncbi:MAG: HAD-IIA family hydrolase [Chloroflexota bacterium]